MSPQRSDTAPVSLVQRAMSVLSAFTGSSRALSLSDIASKTNLPVSTTHRVVKELQRGGFLVRTPDKLYHVGTKLWLIAMQAPINDQLREAALPALALLHEATGQNVNLAVYDRGRTLYVDRIYTQRAVPTISRAGDYLPLHTTGVGKCLLAFQPETEIENYLSHPLTKPTNKSITDPEKLRAELLQIREQGYSVAREEMSVGASAIGVPILIGDRIVAAIGVVVSPDRLDIPSLVTQLKQTAKDIAFRLQYS